MHGHDSSGNARHGEAVSPIGDLLEVRPTYIGQVHQYQMESMNRLDICRSLSHLMSSSGRHAEAGEEVDSDDEEVETRAKTSRGKKSAK